MTRPAPPRSTPPRPTPPPASTSSGPRAYLYTIDDTNVAVTLHEPARSLPERVPEALVQDLWARQSVNPDQCYTVDGRLVQVLDPGTLNTDAGPDFRDAHLRIGTMAWRGDVEIHNQSHGWIAHKHDRDPRYNSVVLHVTLTTDMWTGRLRRSDGSPLPEMVLDRALNVPLRSALHRFLTQPDAPLLCASQWDQVDTDVAARWMRQLGRVRIRQKADALTDPLEKALFERVCAGMGYANNDEAMSALSARCPLSFLRTLPDAETIEAALLGWAGLLPGPEDLVEADRPTADYAMRLRDIFRRLRQTHNAPPMSTERWTFFRLRPNNVPPLRVAQLARWIAPGGWLRAHPINTANSALEAPNPRAALQSMLASEPGLFWQTHRRLDRTSKPYRPTLGTRRRDTLILNALVPVLLRHRRATGGSLDPVWHTLNALPVASDRVTRLYRELGTRADDTVMAQGMHELYRAYCTEGRCLQCDIGTSILTGNS